jgi:hypothetical protein
MRAFCIFKAARGCQTRPGLGFLDAVWAASTPAGQYRQDASLPYHTDNTELRGLMGISSKSWLISSSQSSLSKPVGRLGTLSTNQQETRPRVEGWGGTAAN